MRVFLYLEILTEDRANYLSIRGEETTAGGEFSRKRLITTEGTTKRGWASVHLRKQYDAKMVKAGGRYRRSSVNRLMTEEIYQIAGGDRDLALTLLHKNGYPTDTTPDLSGKCAWAKRDQDVHLQLIG